MPRWFVYESGVLRWDAASARRDDTVGERISLAFRVKREWLADGAFYR